MPNIARSSRNGPSKGVALQNCSTRCSDDSLSGHNLPCHSFCIMKSIPTKSKHTSSCSHALSAKHRHSDVRTRSTQRLPLCFVTCITLLYLCVSTRNIASRVYGPATSLSACTAHGSGRISKPASPARTASCSNEYRRSVPAGRTDHSRSSSAKGKNVRSHISTLSIRCHDVQMDFTDMNTESAPSTNLANAGSSSSSNHLNFSKYMKQDVKTYKGWRKSLQHELSAVKHRMLKSTP